VRGRVCVLVYLLRNSLLYLLRLFQVCMSVSRLFQVCMLVYLCFRCVCWYTYLVCFTLLPSMELRGDPCFSSMNTL